MSPSLMPVISATLTIRRTPPRRRDCWTIMWMAEATVSRMAREGRSWPACSTRVSRRTRHSWGLLACSVDIEPSCPVFIAWSMSRASPPRHSPTMMRSGRIRGQLLPSSRIGTAPFPSTFGGRDSSWIQWGCWSWSSAASSHVISRSVSGMKDDRMLRSVVFPEPVPPATRMLNLARTQERRNDMSSGLDDLKRFTTSAGPHFSLANFRIVRHGPFRAIGGMTTLTRDPSLSRASQMGVDSSTRRPTRLTMRSMTCRIWRSLSGFLDVDLLRVVGHDLGDGRVGEERFQRTKAQHVVEDRVDQALLVVLGHRHRGGAEIFLGELEDLFAHTRLVARVDLVGVLLDQAGVDLNLGRRESRREVPTDRAGGG